jgi:hypothetical protein
MNFDKWPIWVHAMVAVYAIALLAISGTKIYKVMRPQQPSAIARSGGVAAPGNSGNITATTATVNKAPIDKSPAAKVQSANTIYDSSSPQTQDNRTYNFNLFSFNFSIPGLPFRSYKGRATAPDGTSADVKVHILWNEASWHFGTTRFNEAKLEQFLRSPEYQQEMKTATAIVCIGLSSNWVDSKGTTYMTDQRREIQFSEEEKTDLRAFKLCQMLSRKAQEIGAKPQFFGLGLGYQVDRPSPGEEEMKQRALVLLTIKSDAKQRLTPVQAKAMLEEIMGAEEIKEFEGDRYSRVVEGRQICWMETFNGTFVASNLRCAE